MGAKTVSHLNNSHCALPHPKVLVVDLPDGDAAAEIVVIGLVVRQTPALRLQARVQGVRLAVGGRPSARSGKVCVTVILYRFRIIL